MKGFRGIMTLEETAKYLKIGKSTLYRMSWKPLVNKSLKTTEIYIHVSTKNLSAIKTHLIII